MYCLNLKKNLSEAPEAGVWYWAESGASIIWGSPGQRASQAGNQVAATFMIRSSDSLRWSIQPRFEKKILESVILNSSMTLYQCRLHPMQNKLVYWIKRTNKKKHFIIDKIVYMTIFLSCHIGGIPLDWWTCFCPTFRFCLIRFFT